MYPILVSVGDLGVWEGETFYQKQRPSYISEKIISPYFDGESVPWKRNQLDCYFKKCTATLEIKHWLVPTWFEFLSHPDLIFPYNYGLILINLAACCHFFSFVNIPCRLLDLSFALCRWGWELPGGAWPSTKFGKWWFVVYGVFQNCPVFSVCTKVRVSWLWSCCVIFTCRNSNWDCTQECNRKLNCFTGGLGPQFLSKGVAQALCSKTLA